MTIPVNNREERSLSHHYASVEDRQKLRDDLRSQLNIAVGPITTPPPTSAVTIQDALMYASPADASRLEELMLMEAIRRSMYDVTIKNTTPGDETQGGNEHEDENEEDASEDAVSEYDYSSDSNSPVTPSQIQLRESRQQSPSQRERRSSNPFDEDFDATGGDGDRQAPLPPSSQPSSQRNPDWNPFNA